MFLKHGLTRLGGKSLELQRVKATISNDEFFDYLQFALSPGPEMGKIPFETELDKKIIISDIKDRLPDLVKWRNQSITTAIKAYCSYAGIIVNRDATAKDGPIRKNGREYITFSNSNKESISPDEESAIKATHGPDIGTLSQ